MAIAPVDAAARAADAYIAAAARRARWRRIVKATVGYLATAGVIDVATVAVLRQTGTTLPSLEWWQFVVGLVVLVVNMLLIGRSMSERIKMHAEKLAEKADGGDVQSLRELMKAEFCGLRDTIDVQFDALGTRITALDTRVGRIESHEDGRRSA